MINQSTKSKKALEATEINAIQRSSMRILRREKVRNKEVK
jgi:hypothetical protein